MPYNVGFKLGIHNIRLYPLKKDRTHCDVCAEELFKVEETINKNKVKGSDIYG